jgi:hypothetical protein
VSAEHPPQRKDIRSIVEFVILVIITPAIAATVWYATSSAESARLQLEYVRIATGILQQPAASDGQRPMREWAVALLNKSAPVKLSREQMDALIDGKAVLPASGFYDDKGFDYGGSDWPSPTPPPKATAR